MQTIDTLVRSVQIIAGVLVVILLAAAGGGLYFFRFHRRRVTEKEIDYKSFRRLDSTEYAKFDDVGEWMVIADGGKRFVGGISCGGCEMRDMEEGERLQVIRGYLSFLNVLDTRSIQFWQMARDVDMEKMIQDYRKKLEAHREKQYLLTLDYEELKKESEKVPDSEGERYEEYYDAMQLMQKEIASMGYQAEQLMAQIQYLESVSGEEADPHLEQAYLFEWTYNALDFTQQLSEAEIYDRAAKQIGNRASAYISALRNCGVKARMLSGVEIMGLMRRYTHPVSAAKHKAEDILQSAYDSIAVTSGSLRQAEEMADGDMLRRVAEEFASMERQEEMG